MGFQNENKLKVGTSVKATINNKVVEAKESLALGSIV